MAAAIATGGRSGGGTSAPPRDEPAALTVRTTVGRLLHAIAAVEEGTRAGEVEAVHHLRVGTRRLRASLVLFAPLVPKTLARFAERELAWLGTTVGAVRDLDVLNQSIAKLAQRLDPELRGTLGPIGVAIRERRTAALEALVKGLGSPRYRRLRVRLDGFSGSPLPARQEPLADRAPRLIRPLLRATVRAGRAVDADSSPAELHRLRVRVKRLRYAVEALRGPDDKAIDKLIRRLVRLQDVLGDHQDAVTQGAWLRTHAETTLLAPGPLLGVGALLQLLSRRARHQRDRFPKAWKRFDDAKLHRRVLETIAGTAEDVAA